VRVVTGAAWAPDALGASCQGAEDRLGELVKGLFLQGLAGSLTASLAAALEGIQSLL
jgi:hypothetical protein